MHTVVKRTRLHPQHRISKQHLGDVTDISADAYCSQERPTTPATSHLTATPKRSQQHNFKTTAPSRAESTCPDDCGMPIALPQRSKEKWREDIDANKARASPTDATSNKCSASTTWALFGQPAPVNIGPRCSIGVPANGSLGTTCGPKEFKLTSRRRLPRCLS